MILGIANVVGTVITTVGDILGNPKDAERKATADSLYAAALGGDAVAEIRLRCLSGDQTVKQQAIQYGLLTPDEIARGIPCGFATEVGRQYAANLVTKLRTQRAIAGVAGDVSTAAAGVGVQADPKTYLATVGSNLGVPVVPSWVWIAGGAAILVWLYRRGK